MLHLWDEHIASRRGAALSVRGPLGRAEGSTRLHRQAHLLCDGARPAGHARGAEGREVGHRVEPGCGRLVRQHGLWWMVKSVLRRGVREHRKHNVALLHQLCWGRSLRCTFCHGRFASSRRTVPHLDLVCVMLSTAVALSTTQPKAAADDKCRANLIAGLQKVLRHRDPHDSLSDKSHGDLLVAAAAHAQN
jgi:hypothetical protein